MSPLRIALFASVLALLGCSAEPGPSGSDDVGGVDASDARTDAGTLPEAGGPDAGSCTAATDCDDGTFCNGAEACDRTSPAADARGCVLASAGPCGTRSCNETTDACEGCPTPDADGDGHAATACGGDDCDDANAARFPGHTEVCDLASIDEDCDAETFGFRDRDGDGFPDMQCCNGTACGDDCDDLEAAVHPAEAESCDGLDNDCDTVVDEGVHLTFYRDVDGDLFGVTSMSRTACSAPVGYTLNGGDCDDAAAPVHPGASEVCDTVDNDCDGSVDPGCMCTIGDPPVDCGFRDATGAFLETGACQHGTQDCIAGELGGCIGNVDPTGESCNTIDDDCDDLIDETVTSTYYRDLDGDSYGDPAMPQAACAAPVGYVPVASDCDDTRAASHPSALETCNGIDDDCDGAADDGVLTTFFGDVDGDGYGGAMTMLACSAPAGFVATSGDCNDSSAAVHPLATEGCNLVDDNCNGTTDEGCACVDGASQTCGTPNAMGGGFNTMGICRTGLQSCASGAWQMCVGNVVPATESCNMRDDDCNGVVDDGSGAPRAWYQDCDRDGYGARGSSPTYGCDMPSTPSACSSGTGGWAQTNSDCADAIAGINPGIVESCDGIDNDCDDTVDGALATSWCNVTPSMPLHTASGATCASAPSVCTYGCASGYLDCNTTPSTYGCEVDGSSDRTNCGGCGQACLATAAGACAGSRCVHDFVQIEAGTRVTCGRQLGGTVMCWGEGYGAVPTLVPGITDATVISVGGDEACAIRTTNEIYCWHGSYGAGRTFASSGGTSTDLSVGSLYACHLDTSDRYSIFCWRHTSSSATRLTPPNMVGFISRLAVGSSHICYSGTGTSIYCYPTGVASPTYTLVPGVSAAAVSVGAHTFCTTAHCWKDDGMMVTAAFSAVSSIDVAPDDTAVCARSSTGTVSCGGDLYASPTTVSGTSPSTSITLGVDHRCIRRTDGAAWTGDNVLCWGTNGFGQIGDGTTTTRAAPTLVTAY
jgi:hypothetical protein